MARVFSKFRYLAFVALVVSLQACAKDYSAEPIEAWVVDAETGKPLEGVIVTANWQLEIGTPGGNIPAGQMMVMETVTDKNGRLSFPGWGPEPIPDRPKSKSSRENTLLDYLLSSEPHLVNRDPQLLFFKSGYKYVGLENKFTRDYNKGSLRRSDWNSKTIKMEKFRGTLEEYAHYLVDLDISLGFAYRGESCEWMQVPRMIAAMDKEGRRFKENHIVFYSIKNSEDVPGQEKCGSAKEFFKDYLK
ncbi:MAG: hypothetical protein ACYC2R_09320 [Burkholderiales bacterium]